MLELEKRPGPLVSPLGSTLALSRVAPLRRKNISRAAAPAAAAEHQKQAAYTRLRTGECHHPRPHRVPLVLFLYRVVRNG